MMKLKLKIFVMLFFLVASLFAESAAPKMAILPTTDLTEWKLAEALQYSLGKMAYSMRQFNVGSSNYVLTGFSKRELKRAFESNRSPLLMFAYIEPSRISVFLFNAYQTGKFIASNKTLNDPPGGKISSSYIETQFRSAFEETMLLFGKGEYQDLPRSPGEDERERQEEHEQNLADRGRAEQMKELFHEISKLEDKPFYFGANIGMVRYAGSGSTTSTVDFGVMMGGRINPRVSVGVGVDFFSYIFAHGNGFYKLPIAERYLSLYALGSVGSVLNSLTENKGYSSNNTTLKSGSFMFGPGFAIDIPLLGASLRGELKYYVGSTNIMVGTYGLVISL